MGLITLSKAPRKLTNHVNINISLCAWRCETCAKLYPLPVATLTKLAQPRPRGGNPWLAMLLRLCTFGQHLHSPSTTSTLSLVALHNWYGLANSMRVAGGSERDMKIRKCADSGETLAGLASGSTGSQVTGICRKACKRFHQSLCHLRSWEGGSPQNQIGPIATPLTVRWN